MKFTDSAEFSAAIRQKFLENRLLHTRMDRDYQDWRMVDFVPDAGSGVHKSDAVTSNVIRTLEDKIVAHIAYSDRLIRVPDRNSNDQAKAANKAAEMLAIGFLTEADQRQMTLFGQPPVQSQLAWFSVVFGGYVVIRAMLMKDDDGETIADILPMNPRHTVLQWGKNEPQWAATRLYRSKSQTLEDYPKFEIRDALSGTRAYDAAGQYDYAADSPQTLTDVYWRQDKKGEETYWNGVIIDDRWAKKPERLYTSRFPVTAIAVGDMPLIAPGMSKPSGEWDVVIETIEDFGESIAAPLRKIVQTEQRLLSYRMALAALGVNRSYKLFSSDGTKSLDSNPAKKGQEVQLSKDNQEDLELLELSQLSADADKLAGAISEMKVEGGLPAQAFGILPAPISSLALKQLGNNLEQKVAPRLRAVQMALEAGLEGMIAQFETGSYRPVRVYGKTLRREPFDTYIQPEQVYGRAKLEVSLVPVFPEEEVEKWQTAQVALAQTAAGEPVASVKWVRQEILHMEDAEQVSTDNMEALARLSDPMAKALQLYKAALAKGDQMLASIWLDELNRLNIMKQVQTIQAQLALMEGTATEQGGGGQGGQNPNGSQPRPPQYSGQVAPTTNAMTQPQPSPEAGANTTAPRNGNQQREATLNSVGLTGGQ